MTEEQDDKITELHDFWFKPHIVGRPSRASQVDDILAAVRASRNVSRAILWTAGFLAAVAVAWSQIKGLFK